MADVLRVTTLEVGDPMPLFVLVKPHNAPVHQGALRRSMYVDTGMLVLNPNFS